VSLVIIALKGCKGDAEGSRGKELSSNMLTRVYVVFCWSPTECAPFPLKGRDSVAKMELS